MASVSAETKRPAEADGLESPRKKARKDPPASEREVFEGEVSEGEVSEGVDEGEVDSDGDSKGPESSTPGPASTWNSGVTNKLRTSFGTSSQPAIPPRKPEPSLELQPRPFADVRDGLASALRADEDKAASTLAEQDASWTLPAFKAESVVGNTWSEVFESILAAWGPEFLAANRATIVEVGLGGSLLKKAFNQRLKQVSSLEPELISTIKGQMKQRYKETRLVEFAPGFKPGLGKQLGKGASREAKARAKDALKLKYNNPLPSENPTRIQPSRQTKGQENDPLSQSATRSNSPATTSDDSSLSADLSMDGTVEADEDEVRSTRQSGDKIASAGLESNVEMADIEARSSRPVAEDELEQRHHYYPGLPDDATFCLTCASYNHATADCPETICKFCQQEHFSYQCPSRQRCGKCKQLGHAKSSCKEKLAIAPGEGFIECAFCEAQDHQEDSCTEVWQTYRPQVGHTKKVKSLPIFCYCCGAEGHFGTDCGLADPRFPHNETWSLANASLYVDPTSSEEAVAFKSSMPLPSSTSLTAPSIPGRSIKPQSHIIFEDSGDDEADGQSFIRAPTAGAKRPGQIQITSNINFDALAGVSAQQGPTDVRQRRRQRQQQHNLAQQQSSLPPKPNFAPQKGSQQSSTRKGSGPPNPPAPPPASKKGKKKGKGGNKAPQQPPLPSGPLPNSGWRPQAFMPQNQQDQQRGANKSRGPGGFSSLGRGGGRGGRGRRHN
ncbi:hypothetical protein VPNG_06868 [Cytospora leucostoma]|uniref:CCHC-type domain-containing protein n=1 Tax=Cytospora leucostoma TaxID=1230097 RepID=A0A423WVT5_9PEZI|nr:hypothetical protein VPNG_06868 [Cytospora leucostoma]